MTVSLIGDFNGNGVVNLADHSLFVAAFGLSEGDDGYFERAFFHDACEAARDSLGIDNFG